MRHYADCGRRPGYAGLPCCGSHSNKTKKRIAKIRKAKQRRLNKADKPLRPE